MTNTGFGGTPMELAGSIPAWSMPRLVGAARIGLACAAVALFSTNLDGYAHLAWGGPVPSRLVLLFAAAAAGLAFVHLRKPMPLLRSPLLAWTLAYFLVTTWWMMWTPPVPAVVEQLRDRFGAILLLVTSMLLFDDARARRAAAITVAVAVVIASLLNVGEFLSLVRFAEVGTRTAGRAGGLYINPNESGLALALGTAVAAPAIPGPWRVPLLVVAGMGIVSTFSRGAAISLALVLLTLLASRRLGGRWYVAMVLAFGFALATQAARYVNTHGLLNENTAARVRLQHHDSERLALATKAWDLFGRSPVVGNGVGATITWDSWDQAHNMYLTLAADHGVIGLLLYPALGLALVASRRSSLAFVLALMAAGLTSHSMLETRYTLVLIALAGARGAREGEETGVEARSFFR